MNSKIKLFATFLLGFIFGIATLSVYSLYIKKKYTTNLTEQQLKSHIEFQLDDILKSIEFYNLRFGTYPSSLTKLTAIGMHIDPNSQKGVCVHEYYYHLNKVNNTYVLLSAGKDHIAFTDDDIVPQVEEINKIGLRLQKEDTYPKVTCHEMDNA